MYNKYQALINELKQKQIGVEDTNKNSRVLLVDGLNTFIRSYSASPVTNSDGEHVGGISGFLLSVGHAIKAINPTRVVVVFDGKDGAARRRSIFPEYKANRKVKIRLNRSEVVDKEDNQLKQLVRLVDYLGVLPITTLIIDKAEADDVIAYLAKDYFSTKDSQVFIMSSDKDFLQLVNNEIHVWSPTKKKLFYTQDVQEEYGICPENFALYRSLIGDKSDNIPGVSGVGRETALKKFPKLGTDPINLEDFMKYVTELSNTDKAKVYTKVLQEAENLKTYYQIIQLGVSNIPFPSRGKIRQTVEAKINPLAKIKFHTMLVEDRMADVIKNVELWLKEVTSKLDRYCLED